MRLIIQHKQRCLLTHEGRFSVRLNISWTGSVLTPTNAKNKYQKCSTECVNYSMSDDTVSITKARWSQSREFICNFGQAQWRIMSAKDYMAERSLINALEQKRCKSHQANARFQPNWETMIVTWTEIWFPKCGGRSSAQIQQWLLLFGKNG
jgi:hypothetical protein